VVRHFRWHVLNFRGKIMSQAGFTPIQLYHSTTAAAAPTAGNLADGELSINITDGKLFYKDNLGVVQVLATKAGASGDVVGPASSTDNALVRFDSTTGKLVQNSVGILDDSGNLTGLAAVTMSGALTLSGGTANGVAFLNGSKVLTSGSALTFDGSKLTLLSSGEQLKLESTGDFSSTGQGFLRFYDSGGAKGYLGYAGTASRMDLQTGAGMNFNLNATGGTAIFSVSNAEQMRLTSTGLGIGTSSPAAKLDVAGEALIQGRLQITSATPDLLFSVPSGGLDSRIHNDGSGNLIFGNGTNSSTPTERMRLDSSGNLGLGVTPSAWGNGVSLQGDAWAISTTLGFNAAAFSTNARQTSYGGATGWVYRGTASAGLYHQSGGNHEWYNAPSGTAGNAISFTQAMTLTAAGNLGIGTTSPGAKLDIAGSGTAGMTTLQTIRTGVGNSTGLQIRGNFTNEEYLIQNFFNSALAFGTNNTERARIDSSGNLLVGTTAGNGSRFEVYASAEIARFYNTSGQGTIRFVDGLNVTKGSIVWDSTLTVYNTTSDYRLKTVVGSVTGQGERIDALQPVEYTWKENGTRTRGFLAHQFQEVYAGSVTGSKDAVDAGGKPVYQQMQASTSEVIADLVAEIQSLRARVAALESN
jgi:hypothetical protein